MHAVRAFPCLQDIINEVNTMAHQAKAKLEQVDKLNAAALQKKGQGVGSASERTRTSITSGMREQIGRLTQPAAVHLGCHVSLDADHCGCRPCTSSAHGMRILCIGSLDSAQQQCPACHASATALQMTAAAPGWQHTHHHVVLFLLCCCRSQEEAEGPYGGVQ